MYLFEARRHAPATGLHDAVVAAHVLADLPVLFAPLLSAGHHRRVTEERCNTVTGQSADSGEGGQAGRGRGRGREREREREKERERKTGRSVSSLASQQQEIERSKTWRRHG